MTTAQVTWLGHATALIAMGDDRFLVDPLGRSRSRSVAPFSTILITHSHVDHLNRWTLRGLDRSCALVVPKGALGIVNNLGFSSVVEVEPGDQLKIGSTDLICVGTRHDNGRWSKGDSPICVGYILARDGQLVHHAGDVDMSTYDVFDDIGKRFQINTTLLPIGGMMPPWYYRKRQNKLDQGIHICPATALGISERLGASNMVPIHWGTVCLRLFHRASAPKRELLQVAESQGALEQVRILDHGETLHL